MNNRERKELATAELVLLVLAIIGLLFVIWWAWLRPEVKKTDITNFKECRAAGNPVQTSLPEVCTTKDGKRFVNSEQQLKTEVQPAEPSREAQTDPDATTQSYATITEWGVRVPLDSVTYDLAYTYTQNDTYQAVSFTFKRLQDAGICQTDAGVSLTRSTTENKPPYTIDNPQVFKKIGTYYYYAAYGSSPCYDPDNAGQVQLVKSIAPSGSLKELITTRLQKLEAVQ